MGLQKFILNIALEIVHIFTFFLRPKKNRITFISLTQKELKSDFKLLYDALEKENKYDIHTILMEFENSPLSKIHYFFNCLYQWIEIKQSSLVILNDNNYIVSHKLPDGVKVLQMWHACGAVKKFGNQIQRKYPIRNYGYVLCNSDYWKPIYSEAFHVQEEQVICTGSCRIDTLLNKDHREEFYERYPELIGKKLCLYAPTFRGNIIDGFRIQSFDFTKIKEYVILYKFHPLLGNVEFPGGINMNQEDLYTLMQVSDCMISDYSSVIFDYSLLNKPMISYIPDVDLYSDEIGLNIDYKNDFPGPICLNEDELKNALKLENYDFEKLKEFQKKYMKYTDGMNTKRVVEKISEIAQL